MPYYLYEANSQTREIFQKLKEDHSSFVDSEGILWTRVYTSPNISTDTKWDEDSSIDFINKSKNKKGNLGDLMNKSKELSDKREQKYGIDKIKRAKFDSYSKERKGRRHPADRPKVIENKNFKITLD